jgi:hypothetical protein
MRWAACARQSTMLGLSRQTAYGDLNVVPVATRDRRSWCREALQLLDMASCQLHLCACEVLQILLIADEESATVCYAISYCR